jgi:hypothetical protein
MNRRPLLDRSVLVAVLGVTIWGAVGPLASSARASADVRADGGPTAALAAGPTLDVDRFDDDGGAVACTDTVDDCSLRGALINANADGTAEIETIRVPAGTYVLSIVGTDSLTGSLNVSS